MIFKLIEGEKNFIAGANGMVGSSIKIIKIGYDGYYVLEEKLLT